MSAYDAYNMLSNESLGMVFVSIYGSEAAKCVDYGVASSAAAWQVRGSLGRVWKEREKKKKKSKKKKKRKKKRRG